MFSKCFGSKWRASPFRVASNELARNNLLLKLLIYPISFLAFKAVRRGPNRRAGRYRVMEKVAECSSGFTFDPKCTCFLLNFRFAGFSLQLGVL